MDGFIYRFSSRLLFDLSSENSGLFVAAESALKVHVIKPFSDYLF
jgi:hypothetical protein